MTPYIRNTLLTVPFGLLSLVPFVVLANYLGLSVELPLILFGALGWWLALLLRLPVMLIAKATNLSADNTRKIIIGASGPTEELTRLTLLLVIGLSAGHAFSVGLGWAAIEILYSIVQGIAMGVLDKKTDPKAMEAKAFMKQKGMDKAMARNAPYWGVVERLAANAIHIGFSLLIAFSPIVLIGTIPLHSAINFGITRLMKQSLAKAELAFAVTAALVFIAGIALVP